MHIRNILKKGYSLFCYLQLYFRWYNKVVTERLKYNRKVLDMNIAAYCRVSTDKADQLNSLEAQKEFFSEYMIIPVLFEPPVRTLRATIPENESHIFR